MLKKTLLCLATALSSLSVVDAMPAQIIMFRHGEKPDPDNNHLSVKGYERARAFIPYLTLPPDDGVSPNFTKYGLPVAIYAGSPDPSRGDYSVRTIDMVTPLAEELGLPVISQYSNVNYDDMVDEIKNKAAYNGKNVVICWKHARLNLIAEAFGIKSAPYWENTDFDHIWILTFPNGKPAQAFYAQKLLYGDSSVNRP